MGKDNQTIASNILPVPRTKEEARRFYNRLSRYYDYIAGRFERRFAEMTLERLGVEQGESVLEIGFGSGHCLRRVAVSVGETGKACGIDISPGMLEVTRKRLEKAGLMERVQLDCGDAANLPYHDNAFDAVFMSYTLELFDTPEIPRVLEEVSRVLKPGGRLGVVAMSREGGAPAMLRLYEWAHKRWPRYLDCRPIYVEQSLRDAGYAIKTREKVRLFGLPNEIMIAMKSN